MKTIIFKKCLLMSLGMGFLMGLVFSIMNQLKSSGHIQPVGVLVGICISMVVSAIVGMIFNMKVISDKLLGGLFHLNTIEPGKKVLFYIGEAIIGSVIFTPFNMFFNQLYGMYMSFTMANNWPPFATSFIGKCQFLFSGPFFPAYLGGLGMSMLICIPISLIGTLLFGKVTDKMVGI